MSENEPFLGAIAAMTRDNVIGLDKQLPWHYSEDLKRFKKRTLDCAVIMGRLTWESMGGKALPKRRNIVITRSKLDDVEHYDSIERALQSCEHELTWIIGGGQIYGASMNYLTLLDITYVPDTINDANAVTFPPIDPTVWEVSETTPLSDSLVNVIYKRKKEHPPQSLPVLSPLN